MCAHSIVQWWQRQVPRKTLTIDEFCRIIDQLPHVTHALISGIGEPLLDPHIIDRIQYARSKGISTSFFTNATLLTPDKAMELINTEGLVNINVSIDAGNPETYEKIRIGANFLDVCSNIESFVKKRSEMGKNKPLLSVWMVAMRENIREIPALIQTLGELGVNNLSLHHIYEAEETKGQQISPKDMEIIQEYKKSAAKQNFVLSFRKLPDENTNKPETRTCIFPWETVYINATGWINPCCYSYHDKSTYFGNIFDSNFREIWNNKSYVSFRHELKTGMPDCCLKCPFHSSKWSQ
jgi:MoaA/NifB/PqqE/SkfB family radical SAM enzyme